MLVSEFCKGRGIPKLYERMFEVFIRSSYAEALLTSFDGDTVKGIAANMPENRLERLWLEFVHALRCQIEEMGNQVRIKETDDISEYDSIGALFAPYHARG